MPPFEQPSPSHMRSISSIDTSYSGSGGLIEDNNIDLARDGYDGDILLPSPSKAVLPRQALSARLMSTISNAQSPGALNRSRSIIHERAKSFAQLVPKIAPSTTTPSEHSGRESPASQTSSKNQFLNNLFAGESAPVRLGVASSPTKEEPEPFMPEYKTVFTERPAPRRVDSGRPTDGMRKSSWFTRKFTPAAAASTTTLSPRPAKNDELATLDIHSSLFPHGPADPHDPHAFNDLLLNATSLLEKMQAAYRDKSEYLANVQPEIDAQKEEVEEAEIRSRHLKMQLEDMCTKAAEQDKAMRDMAMQLAEEKIKLQEEKDRAARSLRMVPKSDEIDFATAAERRFRKRSSAGSASDSGFESDYAESIMSSGMETPVSVHSNGIAHWQQSVPVIKHDPRSVPSRQNTIRSVVSSASGDSTHRMGPEAAAWTTVDQLRRENRGLNKQLAEMQYALQGCIDLVGDTSI